MIQVRPRSAEYEQTKAAKRTRPKGSCYLKWRQLELRLKLDIGIDDQLVESFMNEKLKWRNLLKKIFDVNFFISKRGLAFQSDV